MGASLKTLLVFTTLLVFPAPASASNDGAIDEIQVTASRRPMTTREVSAAVSVVRTDDVASANLVTDLLHVQPGAYLQETTPGQGAVILRGLKGSEVLHLVDGMRLNNAIFRNAPTQYAALLDPAGVERAEIVRGTGASLYGSGAMGGVVNFLMRRPEPGLHGLTGDLQLGANSADLARKASLGVEASNTTLAALARVSWLDTGNRRSGTGNRIPYTGFESRAARFALVATPRENRRWYLDVQTVEQPRTARVDELIPGYGEIEPGTSEFFFEPNSRKFVHAEYEALQALWGIDWDIDVAWQQIVDDRTSRAYQSDTRRLETNRSDLFFVDLDVSREVSFGQWLVGVEWAHDTVSSTRTEVDIHTADELAVAPRFPDNSKVEQGAVYARVLASPGTRHELFGGLRYNSSRVSSPAAGARPAAKSRFNDLSGDIGWTYRMTESLNLVANLGRGFRAPNVFDLGTLGERPGNRFNIPSPALDAEHVTQADIGLKGGGDKLSFELYVFSLDYEDRLESIATGDTTPDGREITQSRNLASANLHGIEGMAFVKITNFLSLDAVLNFTRGTSRVAGDEETPADRIPPLNGRVGLTYDPRSDWRGRLFVMFADRQDRLSPRDVADPRINPVGTAGWVTANARLDYDGFNSWLLTLAVENIFDAHYRAHGSGVDARGRNVLVSASYRW